MEIAVMYSDSSDLTVTEKIEKYSALYKYKYGIKPDVCHIHPSLFDLVSNDEVQDIDIKLVSDNLILINNFWIGVEKGSFRLYSELRSAKDIEE